METKGGNYGDLQVCLLPTPGCKPYVNMLTCLCSQQLVHAGTKPSMQINLGWEGFVGEFLHANDSCAGDATVVWDNVSLKITFTNNNNFLKAR